jgi:hypothetical protein
MADFTQSGLRWDSELSPEPSQAVKLSSEHTGPGSYSGHHRQQTDLSGEVSISSLLSSDGSLRASHMDYSEDSSGLQDPQEQSLMVIIEVHYSCADNYHSAPSQGRPLLSRAQLDIVQRASHSDLMAAPNPAHLLLWKKYNEQRVRAETLQYVAFFYTI